MEGTQPKAKKIRSRLKSVAKEKVADETTSLNGEKTVEKDNLKELNPESMDASDDNTVRSENEEGSDDRSLTSESIDDSKSEKQGRKRKISELKSNDDSSDETASKDATVSKDDQTSVENATEPVTNETEGTVTIKQEDLSYDSPSEINTRQMFGKGKRARIPNKRYSDLPLKSIRSSLDAMDVEAGKLNVENGEFKEVVAESESNSEAITKEVPENPSSQLGSPVPAPVAAIKASRSSQSNSPSTPATKKQKLAVDITNPNYLKPFKFGWKRELVYRATSDNNNKRNGDIYYYTPSGKKVRSMREVSENLKNRELTLEDFTFFKEPLGLDDPEKEIIRDAKLKSASSTPASASKKATPKVVAKTAKPAPSPKVVTTEEPKPKNSTRLGGFKIKLPSRTNSSFKSKDKNKKDDLNLEVGTYPPNWPSPPAKKAPKSSPNAVSTNKPCRPCSIRCQGVSGIIPRLQCRICLCLYHSECVGLSPVASVIGYVCKNCQLDQGSSSGCAASIAPPPLTPINALKSINVQSNVLPKLQRIPRANDTTEPLDQTEQSSSTPSELPRLTPRPTLIPPFSKPSDTTNENKSIVGSVTTWFPSSSQIQVSQGNVSVTESSSIVPPPRPQYVEFVGNKQYLIIPKHNIVSVSPTISLSAPSTSTNRLTDSSNISENAPLGGFNYSSNLAPEDVINTSNALDSASLGPSLDEPSSQVIRELPSPSKNVDLLSVDESKGVEGDNVLTKSTSSDGKSEENADQVAVVKKSKRLSSAASAISNSEAEKKESPQLMGSYLQTVAFGYNTLLYVFQYLKVQDLLRAGCVCTMWNDITNHSLLWRTVRMKNSQIHSFKGLANALEKHGTVHLDLRKMLLPSNSNDDIWQEFSTEIKKVDSLRKIELCRCPATVVEQLASSNPKLEVINAVTIKCESMNLAQMAYLNNLQELRLKSTAGFSLTSDLTALAELKQLKHLSLTSIRELNKLNIEVIADLKNLESLDLGECADFPKTFGSQILSKLEKLEKLRLEKGQGNCYTFEILEAVKNMAHLEQLELVNFDIKTGFDRSLGACTNIKKLLIIPTYISQSATTNHMVLGGVLRLQTTLSHFVWGVTLELLRVTELFVDQCEEPEKKERKEKKPIGNGDSIPVLKPVPLLREGTNAEIPPAQDPPQVEILPLPNLQKLLLQSLPTTRVKILKIPFHATWRQSITDTVN